MIREKTLFVPVMPLPERYLPQKRALDMAVAAIALMLLLIPGLLLCWAILLDSPGACPIFRQIRIGKDGVPFLLYKFRTMVPKAESQLAALLPQNEMDGPVFKIKDDPRITRLGKFLRRTGLDELPQLWNVLRGDMSLVGPRPGLPREAAQYDAYAQARLAVRPGITCFWQIQPQRNQLSFRQWMELDHKYLQEQSMKTDLKILFATIPALLRRDGQ